MLKYEYFLMNYLSVQYHRLIWLNDDDDDIKHNVVRNTHINTIK